MRQHTGYKSLRTKSIEFIIMSLGKIRPYIFYPTVIYIFCVALYLDQLRVYIPCNI